MLIRIVTRPRGEAPEWVRDAWIGLAIPTEQHGPVEWKSFGVLSGPRSVWLERLRLWLGWVERGQGYIVSAPLAINLLAAQSPAAAAWWREHCPHLLAPQASLAFRADECKLVHGP
jgi:hypothetical protein